MNSASTGINNIIRKNIHLKLPSNYRKTTNVDVLVSVGGKKTIHSWQFVWTSSRSYLDPIYSYKISLCGKPKDDSKYGKGFYKIKIMDGENEVLVKETSHLVAPNFNQFVFKKKLTVVGNELPDTLMASIILQSYTTDNLPKRPLKRMLDGGCQTDAILQSYNSDSPPQGKLKRMLDSRKLTDVVIKTKVGNFPCHKVVLASESVYFETMFSTDFKQEKVSLIDWDGVFEADVVRDLLHYLYTGQTPLNFPNTCMELMKVAHMCLMDRLKTLCGNRLKETLTVENMGDTLRVAAKYEAEELQQAAVNFIIVNFDSNEHSPAPWDILEPEFGKNLATTIMKTLVAKKNYL